MNALTAVVVIVGVFMALFGLAGAVGVVPGLQVVSGQHGVAFSYSVASYTVTIVDKTNANYGCKVNTGGCNVLDYGAAHWGSGQGTTSISLGQTVSHTYAVKNTTYGVGVSWYFIPTSGGKGGTTYSASATIAVPGNTTGQGSTVNPGFSYHVWPTNLSLTVRDVSTTVNAYINSVGFEFGTGPTTTGAPGFQTTHKFAASGSYLVTEVVNWTAQNGGATTLTPYPQEISINSTLTSGTITPSVVVSQRSLHVWANDTSVVTPATANILVTSDNIAWGDGSSGATGGSLGLHAVHVYSNPGTYTINDSMKWTFNGSVSSTYADATITVKNGTNGTTNQNCTPSNCPCVGSNCPCTGSSCPCSGTTEGCGGCDGPACVSSPAVQFNLATVGLMFAGAALVTFALLPMPLPYRIVGFAVVTVLGLVVGFVVGGPGPF